MEKTPEQITQARKQSLRDALEGVVLTPDVTQDEITVPTQDSGRDQEMVANKPPHHSA